MPAFKGRSYLRPVAIWLAASCVLVVLLGVMQFTWIGRVSDSRDAAIRAPLHAAVKLVIADLHDEMLFLLSTFDPDADSEPARRLEIYTQRMKLWHQTSRFGAVVERVLFFDLSTSGGEALSELYRSSFAIEPAEWGKDLEPIRQHIRKAEYKVGRFVHSTGRLSWMLHPRPLAVYRPIVLPEPVPGHPLAVGTVTGYLILQLNHDVIRSRVIPRVLDDHLGALAGEARHTVTVAVDGEDVLAFAPSDSVALERRTDTAESVGYAARPLPRPDRALRPGASDPVYPFLLWKHSVVQTALRRGAVQQIAMRNPVDILRVLGTKRVTPDPETDFGLDPIGMNDLFNTPFALLMGLPRLFLVSERPVRLTMRASPAGTATEEAMDSNHKRAVAMGMLVLVLLVGSMAMVAVSGIRAVRRAETLLGAVAFQSHRLRTPLAAITVLAQNLASGKLRPDDEVVEHAGLIRDYGQQLNEIVDSTVQLAALESSKSPLDLTLVDVSREARNALEEVGPIIRDAGFTVESSLAEDLPQVRADAESLRQCVGELLRNAVKYGLPGMWVKIETCEAGSGSRRGVRIRVHDRGQGVSSREARKIFEPYYRAPAVALSSVGGSGLGLTLALRSIEEMGGELTLENAESGGSVFTIHLPVAG